MIQMKLKKKYLTGFKSGQKGGHNNQGTKHLHKHKASAPQKALLPKQRLKVYWVRPLVGKSRFVYYDDVAR